MNNQHNHKNPGDNLGQEAEKSETEAEKIDNCAELENKYKRALADYQNLLKQTAQEKMGIIKYANEQLLHEMIPIYDNLKISMKHIGDESDNSWLQGISYVIKQFKDSLEKSGVVEIEAEGKSFDHHTMEAIEKEETDEKEKDGMVAKELKSGYKLNGKVISAARVVVYIYKSKEKGK